MAGIKSISIPKPCQQQWQLMTPVENGRYCESCCKTVVDFTAMTNTEIIAHFSANEQVCGRFEQAQLVHINNLLANSNRVLFPWKKLLAAASLITLIPSLKADAKFKPLTAQLANAHKKQAALPLDTNSYIALKGKVIANEDGSPVPGANIVLKDKIVVAITNLNGEFELTVPSSADSIVVSYIGYKTQIIKIDAAVKDFRTITLVPSDTVYREVVVGGAFVRYSFTKRMWRKIKRIF